MTRLPFVAACLGLMLPLVAWANFGGYEAGNASTGNVQPLARVEDTFRPAGLEQVEMQSELLQITLHIESADVEVNYTLHNPGDKAVKVTAGFPTASQDMGEGGESDGGPQHARRDPRDVSDYHLYVDGKEVPWKLEMQPRAATKQDEMGTYSGMGGGYSTSPSSSLSSRWSCSTRQRALAVASNLVRATFFPGRRASR